MSHWCGGCSVAGEGASTGVRVELSEPAGCQPRRMQWGARAAGRAAGMRTPLSFNNTISPRVLYPRLRVRQASEPGHPHPAALRHGAGGGAAAGPGQRGGGQRGDGKEVHRGEGHQGVWASRVCASCDGQRRHGQSVQKGPGVWVDVRCGVWVWVWVLITFQPDSRQRWSAPRTSQAKPEQCALCCIQHSHNPRCRMPPPIPHSFHPPPTPRCSSRSARACSTSSPSASSRYGRGWR